MPQFLYPFPVKYTFSFFFLVQFWGHLDIKPLLHSYARFLWLYGGFFPPGEGKYPGVGLLGQRVDVYLALQETAKLFCKVDLNSHQQCTGVPVAPHPFVSSLVCPQSCFSLTCCPVSLEHLLLSPVEQDCSCFSVTSARPQSSLPQHWLPLNPYRAA